MTSITEMTVESVVQALIDYRGKTPQKSDSGVRLITAKVIKQGRIEEDPAEYIAEDSYDTWMRRGLPQEGDSLITTEAPLGEVAMIGGDARIALAQRVILLRANPAVILPRFLYYELQTDFVQAGLAARSTGTTVLGIKQSELRQVKVRVLPLPAQRRIASILSAYDDLIENHRKRIAILEEMARRRYREWFVHFRYPGHEAMSLVDSPLGRIPQEWKATTLEAVCSEDCGIQTGPFGSQLHESDYSPSGVPVVMPRILIGFRIDATDADHIPEETAQRLTRHRMQSGDIVYGRRGDIGRRAFISQKHVGWFCGTGCLRIRPNREIICPFYLFNHLGQDAVLSNIRGRAQGVTLPNLSASVMESVPITVPPRLVQKSFESAALPMHELAENLHDQIDVLRRTRDLLLPRLMSGTLSVEALATAEAAVP